MDLIRERVRCGENEFVWKHSQRDGGRRKTEGELKDGGRGGEMLKVQRLVVMRTSFKSKTEICILMVDVSAVA